jgi:tripartite-type tricarboxylate transporter receptor subunit TctC
MKRLVHAATALLVSATAMQVSAADQPFPVRPVRFVVPFTAGSATDALARTLGPKLTDMWNQQVIVDNRGGAGGTIGANIVAKANPDGYTLLLNSAAQAINATLYPKLPYDTVRTSPRSRWPLRCPTSSWSASRCRRRRSGS